VDVRRVGGARTLVQHLGGVASSLWTVASGGTFKTAKGKGARGVYDFGSFPKFWSRKRKKALSASQSGDRTLCGKRRESREVEARSGGGSKGELKKAWARRESFKRPVKVPCGRVE